MKCPWKGHEHQLQIHHCHHADMEQRDKLNHRGYGHAEAAKVEEMVRLAKSFHQEHNLAALGPKSEISEDLLNNLKFKTAGSEY